MNCFSALRGLALFGLAAPGFVASAGAQTIRHVPADFPTIQQAIDASQPGDTVRVAPGEYLERLDLGARAITLESSDGPENTVVDATYLGPVVTIGSGATRATVVQGLTLTHGRHATTAGGIVIRHGSPTIRNNRIVGNLGGVDGNGITAYDSAALIRSNLIARNVNAGLSTGGGGAGGIGLFGSLCTPDSTVCAAQVLDNVIEDNSADRFLDGGGIAVYGGTPRIVGNVIRRNVAGGFGGGIRISGGAAAQIENNLIVDNQLVSYGYGAGIHVSAWPSAARGPYIVNNTFVGNYSQSPESSVVYVDSGLATVRFVNNLVIAGAGQVGFDCSRSTVRPVLAGNDTVVDGAAGYTDVCAGATGQSGNISAMPQFMAPGDYRLAPGSAGVDAGIDAYSAEPLDLAGGARIVGTIDIGAYELPDGLFADGFEP